MLDGWGQLAHISPRPQPNSSFIQLNKSTTLATNRLNRSHSPFDRHRGSFRAPLRSASQIVTVITSVAHRRLHRR
ncbi:hypothetical protein Ddc_02004 [Ditylenchus destructor]|nr:hypothetical protein Ddc_02004 [Ditylenchus destructor]